MAGGRGGNEGEVLPCGIDEVMEVGVLWWVLLTRAQRSVFLTGLGRRGM